MNPNKSKAKRIARWVNLISWSAIGFFAAGFLPAQFLAPDRAFMVAMALAAMGAIPYAIRIGRPLKSALVAAVLGAVAGVGIVNAFLARGALMPQGLAEFTMKYVAAIGVFCAAVGALFGYMALQRRRQMDDEWNNG